MVSDKNSNQAAAHQRPRGRNHPGSTQDHPGSRDDHPRRARVKRRSPDARRGVSPGHIFVILAICLALYLRLFHPGAFADEVARAHVKTLRSREIGDRVIKAEEAVAHREKSHPNQMKLVA